MRMPSLPDPADLAACRALLRQGSRSFHAASRLLPGEVRDAVVALYAFCRVADDAVDLGGGPAAALLRLRQRLALAYAGTPADSPADRCFAALVARYRMPRALPEALLEGFQWDIEGRRYETLAALEAYAARVAGSVGVMMALLMDVRDPAALARAADLGVAMQLTNIARDVGEDARNGRLYLPEAWLREAGLAPAALLARPVHSPALGQVVQRLLDAAALRYRAAEPGIALLPVACRPAILAARLIYAEIGAVVAARGGDSVSARAVVPGRRKLVLAGRALAGAGLLGGAAGAPPLAANAFLVRAVPVPPALPPWWQLGTRWVRVLEMLAQPGRTQP